MFRTTFFILLNLLWAITVSGQQDIWRTFYERSGFLETPRYEATIGYCRALADSFPEIHYTTFGKSPQGRDLPLMILDRDGLTDPQEIRSKGRIIVLLQACIHPGESEGKEAGLILFRNLVMGKMPGETISFNKAILEHISILFIPIFNVDGHERFGPYNRINQNGPKEMGWRTNAVNLNLNRDFLKADTPEMQQWLKMFSTWKPEFFIDVHTTDGADYQYALTYLMEISGNMDKELTRWATESFIPQMTDGMKSRGNPVFPYVGFRNWHDPRSGLITEVAPPMLSQGYTSLRNRPGFLIETHMLKPYNTRVDATLECLQVSLEILDRDYFRLASLVAAADKTTSGEAFLREPFPLLFETSMSDSVMTDFLGFRYTVEKSDLTGGDWFKYSNIPETFRLPWFSSARPVTTARLPFAYIIPAEWREVIERVTAHGIIYFEMKEGKELEISTYRFKDARWQQNPYEGRHRMTNISYDEFEESRFFPAGSVVIPLQQPDGRLIPHMLEPKGNGSFLQWGFFDAIFEQKEYGESYVIEPMAREMLRSDSLLRKEFEKKMMTDTTFAKSPREILNWFYSKTPYADQRRNVYPVGRIFDKNLLEKLKASD